jgi:transcriptional/translational regulatory protein YebC/TACO1
VAYLFEAKGKILVDADLSNEALYDIAAENGANDINELEEGKTELVCDPKDLSSLKEKVESGNFKVEASEIIMEAETNIALDSEQSEKNMKLTDAIEDLDDVQEVFTNADLDESVFTA